MASWALSFERLLQDPLGLAYFTVSPGVGCAGGGRVSLQRVGVLDPEQTGLPAGRSAWSLI